MNVPPMTMYSTLSTEWPNCFSYEKREGGGREGGRESGVHVGGGMVKCEEGGREGGREGWRE